MMNWRNISTVHEEIYVAAGHKGSFLLWKSGRFFYAKYIGREKKFQFPRRKTIEAMKELCEENDYWEN